MTEEIKIRQTAKANRDVVRFGQWADTVGASVRQRTERRRGEFTRRSSKQNLVIEMLPLAKRIAFSIRQHLPAHVEVDELYANGIVGLVDAVSKFDVSKRTKLGTYARHRVRGAILDALRTADPATRELRQKSKSIQNIYRQLEVKLGRPVQDDEIAAAGMNLAQWHRVLTEIRTVGFDCGSRLVSAGATSVRQPTDPEFLVDGSASPFDLTYRREQREILDRALCRLRARERRILTLYYCHELTMKQIADRMGVGESRISQLHSAALGRLKVGVNALLQPREVERAGPGVRTMAAGAGA